MDNQDYHGRWLNADEDSWDRSGEIALATLPRDRWVRLGCSPTNRMAGGVGEVSGEVSGDGP